MFADPKKVAGRRVRRRLKAGAAVALAMVAGAFLACKGGGNAEPTSPVGPDARGGPDARDIKGGAAFPERDASMDASADTSSDAGSDSSAALVVRDGGGDAGPMAPKVDRHEHRKGMPVRDNLLE